MHRMCRELEIGEALDECEAVGRKNMLGIEVSCSCRNDIRLHPETGFLSRREEWIMEAVFKARLIMQKEIEQIFSAGGKMKPFWPGLCCRGGRRWQSIV